MFDAIRRRRLARARRQLNYQRGYWAALTAPSYTYATTADHDQYCARIARLEAKIHRLAR